MKRLCALFILLSGISGKIRQVVEARCVVPLPGMISFSLIALSINLTLLAQAQGAEAACAPDDSARLPSRLVVGQQARVMPDIFLNIRPEPGLDRARISVASPATPFEVLDGPRCADGFVWWQGEVDGVRGWLAEGHPGDATYYLELRGELVLMAGEDGTLERYIRTPDGFLEPQGCLRPPDDYSRVTLGYARLNVRTLAMLDHAQRLYEQAGGARANFRQLTTQGSYNPGGVDASFGTHDGGGAVDLSVRDPLTFAVMEDDIQPMLKALRTAGFAAWLRETDELHPGSVIHIHAIAVGDAEASPIAQEQVSGSFGYLRGFNGLPPADGQSPIPDRYGPPVICQWMAEAGFVDMRETGSALPD